MSDNYSTVKRANQKACNDSGVRSDFIYGNILEQKRYIFALSFINGLDVLDCASGVGWGSFLMAQSGAKKVVGVDLSNNAITTANIYYSAQNVEFVTSALEDLDFCDGSFDVVISFETIEHVNDPTEFLKKLRQFSKKGAKLLLSTPNGYVFKPDGVRPYNPYHLQEYSRQDLERMFVKSGWAVQEYRGQRPMKRDSDEVKQYRLFIKRYWRQKKMIQYLGFPYKVFSFLVRKVGLQIIAPPMTGDGNPTIVEDGFEPAHHFFILTAE